MRAPQLALWLTLTAAPGWSAAQTWQLDYEASRGTLPSAQGWTHLVNDPPPLDGLNEGNYLVALGALTQGDTGGPNADSANTQRYEIATRAMDLHADVIVVDARLRILSSTMTPPGGFDPRAGFAIRVDDKDRSRVVLYVGATGVFLTTAATTPSQLFAVDTASGFVDYRLRLDRYGARLLVNGAEAIVLDADPSEWLGVVATADRVSFGDLSTGHRSSSQLEYLRVARFEPPAAEVRDYQIVTASSASNSTGIKSLTVECPPGTTALSGGVSAIGADGSVGIRESRPGGTPLGTAWIGGAREIVDTSESWLLRVDAVCGEIAGYQALLVDEPQTTDPYPFTEELCPAGKILFGGGAGVIGTLLRQTLVGSKLHLSALLDPPEWRVTATDYGSGAASAGSWGLRMAAICSDARQLEHVPDTSSTDDLSPKQATALCATGKVPISGGARINGHSFVPSALRFSRPLEGSPGAPPVGWVAGAQSDSGLWNLEVVVTCAPLADPTVSKNGLVGRWEGELGAYDSWGIRHGTLENGVGFAPGIRGQAFEFAPLLPEAAKPHVRIPSGFGTGDPYTLVEPRHLYPEFSFTADAWIVTETLEPDDYSTVMQVFDAAGIAPNPNCSLWQLLLTEDGFAFGSARPAVLGPCTSGVAQGGVPLDDGQPHHLALRRDSESRRLAFFVDGVQVDETTLSISGTDGPLAPSTAEGDPLTIGASRVGNSTDEWRSFDGLIDDVKYYDRALTQEEIQNEAGCGRPLGPRVLNLDASRFGRKPGSAGGLCVFLEAGTYTLTLTKPSLNAAARFTAWSPSPTTPWSTVYVADPETGSDVVGGFPTGSGTPDEAFDDTLDLDTTLSIATDQRVYFSLLDEIALDNRGGVSVRITGGPSDMDADGIANAADNCPFRANTAQTDTNGNGVGNACECGDVSGPVAQPDGIVNNTDRTALREHLAAALALSQTALEQCSVIGGADDCDVRDWVVSARAALAPGIAQVCRAAVGP